MTIEGIPIEVIYKIAAVVFGAGALYGQLRGIRKDIARLEKKQEESNNVKMRMAAAEAVQKMHQQELIELKKVVYGNNTNVHN